jgi:hypothetical protein
LETRSAAELGISAGKPATGPLNAGMRCINRIAGLDEMSKSPYGRPGRRSVSRCHAIGPRLLARRSPDRDLDEGGTTPPGIAQPSRVSSGLAASVGARSVPLLLPGRRCVTVISRPVSLAKRWSSRFHSLTCGPLLPPQSAVTPGDGPWDSGTRPGFCRQRRMGLKGESASFGVDADI